MTDQSVRRRVVVEGTSEMRMPAWGIMETWSTTAVWECTVVGRFVVAVSDSGRSSAGDGAECRIAASNSRYPEQSEAITSVVGLKGSSDREGNFAVTFRAWAGDCFQRLECTT